MDLSGYRQATIHLAWIRDDKARRLLFGMVELRPNELPDAAGCRCKRFRAVDRLKADSGLRAHNATGGALRGRCGRARTRLGTHTGEQRGRTCRSTSEGRNQGRGRRRTGRPVHANRAGAERATRRCQADSNRRRAAAREATTTASAKVTNMAAYRTMRDQTLVITQGGQSLNAAKAKRLNKPHNDSWEIGINPVSKDDLTVAIAATTDCAAAGAVCTEDDEALSNSVSATILGPPGLSVADATVEEAEGVTVDFTVTMSRTRSETVAVDYGTSDGTATAGSDYTTTSGTLTFAAGETTKTVSVPVLDDAIDEDSETFTLTLSNPSGGETRT